MQKEMQEKEELQEQNEDETNNNTMMCPSDVLIYVYINICINYGWHGMDKCMYICTTTIYIVCIYMYTPVYVGAYMHVVRVYTIYLSHMCSQTLLNSVCWVDISRSLCIYI